MSAWSNTDNHKNKPKWDVERETREVVQFTILTGNTAGNNVIQVSYNDGGQNNVANVGVVANSYVYFWAAGANNVGGQSGNGVPGFFTSNTQVLSTTGNTITLGSNLFGPANAGWTVEFDKKIAYSSSKANDSTYNADTVLVTPTRLANNTVSMGNIVPGWVNITKSKNGGADGAVRYRHETLVIFSNPVASNTNSGNTSWGQAFTGV